MDSVFAAGPYDFTIQDVGAVYRFGAPAPCAHPHHIHWQVLIGNLVGVQKADDELIIGRDPVICLITAILAKQRTLYEKSGMGRHESETELPWTEVSPRNISHGTVPFRRFYEVDVGEQGTGVVVLKGHRHPFERAVAGIHVVGIQHAYHIAGGKPDPLVHGVVGSMVGFGEKDLDTVAIAFNDLKGSIDRAAIDDDILHIVPCLVQHRLDRGADGDGLVKYNGDDAYFQDSG